MAKNKGMNPVAAGMVGVAVGAAVGAAAVELSDKKKRQKVGKKLGEFKQSGEEAYSGLKKTVIEGKDRLDELSSLVGGKAQEAKALVKSARSKGAKKSSR